MNNDTLLKPTIISSPIQMQFLEHVKYLI